MFGFVVESTKQSMITSFNKPSIMYTLSGSLMNLKFENVFDLLQL